MNFSPLKVQSIYGLILSKKKKKLAFTFDDNRKVSKINTDKSKIILDAK